MATVNKKNLKKAERRLYRNAEFVKEQTAKLLRVFYDLCEGVPIYTDEETENDSQESSGGWNLREYFEQSVKILANEEVFQDDSVDIICKINLMCCWIPITREEVSKYRQLDGEERKKYIDELYMHKLCEWLGED